MSDHTSSTDIVPTTIQKLNSKIQRRKWMLVVMVTLSTVGIYHFAYIAPMHTVLQAQQQQLEMNKHVNATIYKEIEALRLKLSQFDTNLALVSDKQNAWGQTLQRYRQDDIALIADIEQALEIATQQLRLTGNAGSAINLLQEIDIRLRTLNKARFNEVRRAVAQDIKALKTMSSNDLLSAAQKIDQAIASVDRLPLLANNAIPAPSSSVSTLAENSPLPKWRQWLETLGNDIKEESRRLLRVRRIDEPDALLATPEQTWFIRENLRLRLLNARLSLLSGNEMSLRNDFSYAHALLTRYFDMHAQSTLTLQALLNKAQQESTWFILPTLQNSKIAVSALRKS